MPMTYSRVMINQRIRTAKSENNQFELKRWSQKLADLDAKEAAEKNNSDEEN